MKNYHLVFGREFGKEFNRLINEMVLDTKILTKKEPEVKKSGKNKWIPWK